MKDVLLYFFCACLPTVLMECLFWYCFRPYRRTRFLLWCAVVNIFSNITLNIFLGFHSSAWENLLSPVVLIGEVMVVIVEFALLFMLECTHAKRLLMLSFFANLITYSCSFALSLFIF